MKTLLKAASYITAPKLTYAARHPKKAALIKIGSWATHRLLSRGQTNRSTNRREPNRQSGMGMKGLGAAAIALPIGLWLGRRMSQGSSEQMN